MNRIAIIGYDTPHGKKGLMDPEQTASLQATCRTVVNILWADRKPDEFLIASSTTKAAKQTISLVQGILPIPECSVVHSYFLDNTWSPDNARIFIEILPPWLTLIMITDKNRTEWYAEKLWFQVKKPTSVSHPIENVVFNLHLT